MMLDTLDGEFKSCLKYSAALHAGLVLAFAFLMGRSAASSNQVYRIDFIGPTPGIINRDIEAAEKKAAAKTAASASRRPPPQTDRDAFSRKRRHAPLPRPSVLSSIEEKPPAAAQVPERPATPDAQGGAGPANASVSADMPNFPYPWYISQVRGALWNHWSSRMPRGGGEAMAEFTILRNGAVTDLRVESSSGEKTFDDTAVSAVQDAAPFPPLPRGFAESFLKIHVRFTSQ